MSDPYEVLGLRPQADETEVRQRYLELVRANPPDRAPERFAAIRSAYDAVRDPTHRLGTRLFETSSSDTLETLAKDLRLRLTSGRLPLDFLLALADYS